MDGRAETMITESISSAARSTPWKLLPPSSAHALPGAKLLFCHGAISVCIHGLENLLGITAPMGNGREFVRIHQSILVGIHGNKTILTHHAGASPATLPRLPLGRRPVGCEQSREKQGNNNCSES
jgi:hypothetical protein